ncbi:uncharacterized protein BDW47DRAFT_110048 [Aspergillus candidus]|uniref:Uncharacterized protein n=1 Tax=Aspergillus candidus TaxID=41067 RepID=A0A2I2F551_ASPCN|nr:hypothetical protein BDW47DRAFT_110048 [Aspergillus candidus]PLB35734.1 hypothetical protein BDW47DRAFT_110048 [Aspergillus candidus]
MILAAFLFSALLQRISSLPTSNHASEPVIRSPKLTASCSKPLVRRERLSARRLVIRHFALLTSSCSFSLFFFCFSILISRISNPETYLFCCASSNPVRQVVSIAPNIKNRLDPLLFPDDLIGMSSA